MQRASFALLLFVGAAIAHTQMAALTVAGQKRTDCLRGNFDPLAWVEGGTKIFEGFPLQDGTHPFGMLSENYTCGFMPWANQRSEKVCDVNAGDTLALNYWHGGTYTGENPQEDSWISRSHLGPIMISLGVMPEDGNHKGVKWFKIWQMGLMEWAQEGRFAKWASATYLNQHDGKVEFTIPSDLKAGKYLLRSELLALHSAGEVSGAQPYVRCAELNIGGAGSITAAQIDNAGYMNIIPSDAYATLEHPGVHLNVWWDPPKNYSFPGGFMVYKAGDVAGSTPNAPAPSTPTPPPTVPSTPPATPAAPPVAPASGTRPNFANYANCIAIFQQNATSVKFYWTVNGTDINMAIAGTAPTGYISVGLSTDGSMNSLGEGSDAWIVARNSDPKDPCYYKNTQGGCIVDIWMPLYNIIVDDSQDLKNVKVGSDNTLLWGTFTRKMISADTKQDRAISLNREFYLVYGAANQTAAYYNVPYHTLYGQSKEGFKFGQSYTCADDGSVSSATRFVAGIALFIAALLF